MSPKKDKKSAKENKPTDTAPATDTKPTTEAKPAPETKPTVPEKPKFEPKEMIQDPKPTQITATNIRDVIGRVMLADALDMVLDIRKSKGAFLYDSKTNRELLDLFTFVASAPVGSNHPKLYDDKKFLDDIQHASIMHPTQSDVYTIEMAEFVDTFRRLAMPPEMKYVFFVAGGTLGVENALKAAFDWKVRKNLRKGIAGERGTKIIHFQYAFHGRSGYALSLTNTDPIKTMYFPKFDWPRISTPKAEFPLTPERLSVLEKAEAKAIDEIKKAFEVNKDDIAALILEPIQGEGGDNHFRKEFLVKLREITLENDCMLIFDEVQCGVGLSGTMWTCQQLVMPDMIAFGKKMQVCGFMSSARIDEVPENVFKVPSRINSTWGGSLSDMVRAKKYLEIIYEDKLVENAKKQGAFLLNQLEALAKDFPTLVSNVRGRGLMCAFDLPTKEQRGKFVDSVMKNGVVMLGCGERSIRFRPPLTITENEIKKGIESIRQSLKTLA